MNIAIYGRVSTTDKGQEVENQLTKLREYAGANSWNIYKEYVDRIQGWKSDRPEFKRMFADASKRLFDLVLFWSLDRFSREGTTKTLYYLDILRGYGVGFRSLQEPYIDSVGPFADVVISLLATIASFERKRYGERVKAGLDRRKAQGKPIGRKVIVVDASKVLERIEMGESVADLCVELKIKKSALYRKLKDYKKATNAASD